jgi:hypothetical protein
MEGTMRLMIASPHNDEINEIWIQISKLLPSFTNIEQLMFLVYSFDLKLQESSSFKPVILGINKFINSMNPINQLELFNKLKSMKDISKIIFLQTFNLSDSENIHNHLEVKAQTWLLEKIREGLTSEEFRELFSLTETSFKQKFITKIFNSKDLSAIDLLPFMTPFTSNKHPDIQRTFLIEIFHNSNSYDEDYYGTLLKDLLTLQPSYFSGISPENHKYVNKVKIFELHKAEAVSDELYNQIINQLGGKDKFFDPSLKLVISKDIDPVVKKLFDKIVYSKNIEGRLDDIALTLDSLVQKDTSGLMKTILETADLSEKFLIQNDVFSPKLDSPWWGYARLHDVVICSMEQQNNMQVATTIIHELAHKLLIFIFENSSNPYYYGDILSLEESSSLAQILKEFEPVSQKHKLFYSYDKDQWSCEIISHLFQDLAEQILTGKASKSVLVLSEKLNNWVKDYLKQEIHDFDSAYEVLGSKILTEYSSQQVIFKHWSQKRIDEELETISSLQKIADQESTSTDSFDITGTILSYLEPEEPTLEVVGES